MAGNRLEGVLDPSEVEARLALNKRERADIVHYVLANPDYIRDMDAARKSFADEFVSVLKMTRPNQQSIKSAAPEALVGYAIGILENSLLKRTMQTQRFLLTKEKVDQLLSAKSDPLAEKLGLSPEAGPRTLPTETLSALYSQLEIDNQLVRTVMSIAKKSSLAKAVGDEELYSALRTQFPNKESLINYLELSSGLSNVMNEAYYTRFERMLEDLFTPPGKPAPDALTEVKKKARAALGVWATYCSKRAAMQSNDVYPTS